MRVTQIFALVLFFFACVTVNVDAQGCPSGQQPRTPCADDNTNWYWAVTSGFGSRRLLQSQWIGCSHEWMSCGMGADVRSRCCLKCTDQKNHNYNCEACPAGKIGSGGNDACYTPSPPPPPPPPPPSVQCGMGYYVTSNCNDAVGVYTYNCVDPDGCYDFPQAQYQDDTRYWQPRTCAQDKASGSCNLPYVCSACCQSCQGTKLFFSSSYCTAPADTCTQCGAGKFSTQRTTQCSPCPANSGSDCTVCNAAEQCLCNPGFFKDTDTVCRACLAGKYKSAPGNVCDSCAAGKFSAFTQQTSSTTCSTCASGKFSMSGSSACTSCIAGKYLDNNVCNDCPAGSTSPDASAAVTACAWCTAGKYAAAGDLLCSNCTAGKFSVQKSSVCTSCSPGKYSATTSATICLSCATGKYSSNSSATVCTSCANNAVTLSTDSSSASQCLCTAGYENRTFSRRRLLAAVEVYPVPHGPPRPAPALTVVYDDTFTYVPHGPPRHFAPTRQVYQKALAQPTSRTIVDHSFSPARRLLGRESKGGTCMPCQPYYKNISGNEFCMSCPDDMYSPDGLGCIFAPFNVTKTINVTNASNRTSNASNSTGTINVTKTINVTNASNLTSNASNSTGTINVTNPFNRTSKVSNSTSVKRTVENITYNVEASAPSSTSIVSETPSPVASETTTDNILLVVGVVAAGLVIACLFSACYLCGFFRRSDENDRKDTA